MIEKPLTPRVRSDEPEQEVLALTDVHLRRLALSAKRFAYALSFGNEDDLVQAAIQSYLEKRRIKPPGVSLVTFLINAMRSIASNDRESTDGKFYSIQDALDSNDDCGAIQNGSPNECEDGTLAAEAEAKYQRLYDLFKDDDEVTSILVAKEYGYSRAQTIQETGMSGTTYDTAMKRINRCKKAFQKSEARHG